MIRINSLLALLALAAGIALAGIASMAPAAAAAPPAPPAAQEGELPRLQGGITTTPGEAMAWGRDAEGQVGNDTCFAGGNPGAEVICHAPVIVHPGDGLTKEVVAISAGGVSASDGHTLAVLDDGSVWAWGNDDFGQLGDGGTFSNRSRPVQVAGLTDVVAVAAGGRHSLALKSNGTVVAWGSDVDGQLGNGGSSANQVSPVPVSGIGGPIQSDIIEIAAGGSHSLALRANGNVYAWGKDDNGQLGEGAGSDDQQAPVTVTGLSNVKSIAAGFIHSLALEGNKVAAWGDDTSGQLGNGTTTTADQHSFVFVTTGIIGNFLTEVAAGKSHSLARGGGDVWAWGSDGLGQLGNDTTLSSRNVPTAVQLADSMFISDIAAGGDTSFALDKGGALRAWGSDNSGQLGEGLDNPPSFAPIPITVSGSAGVGGVTGIAAGEGHAVAVRALCDGVPATKISDDSLFGNALEGTSGNDVLAGTNEGEDINGLGGNDTICGGDGDDVIDGGTGDNKLFGGLGNDTVKFPESPVVVNLQTGDATQGSDSDELSSFINVRGSEGNDTITGNAQSNVIEGLGGNDTLHGGAHGSDTLVGGAGADDFNGGNGSGSDTVIYSASFTLNLDLSIDRATFDSTTEDLIAIENVVAGGTGDHVITGDDQVNRLEGGGGDDTIKGGAANDTLLGGLGDDDLDGGPGLDNLDGGSGRNKALYPDDGPVVVDLNLNTAQTPGGVESAVFIQDVVGSPLNDTLKGGVEINSLDGAGGNDILRPTSNPDVLDGGEDTDTLDLSLTVPFDAQVNLATGSNNFQATLLRLENILGSPNDDTLVGSDADNEIDGADGNDTINGRAGGDTLDGGPGVDMISYEGLLIPLTLSLADQSNDQGDKLFNFENARGSAAGDTLTGSLGPNVIEGGNGGDTIKGGSGDDILKGEADGDTIDGGAGRDELDGGDDIDTLSYESSRREVTVELRGGTSDEGDKPAVAFENIKGSRLADNITGDARANTLDGGEGDDVLDGAGGADILDGGAGLDTVSFANAPGPVTLGLTDGSNDQGATLRNFENATGSPEADNLTGDSNANVLKGGAGNDTIAGLGGADTLQGETGDDTLDGGDAIDNLNGGDNADTLSYASSAAAVNVNLGTGANSQGDTLAGFENLRGSPSGDILTGDANANILDGAEGNDRLKGGGGADNFIGGAGLDTLDYLGSSALVLNLNTGSNNQDDTFSEVENVRGTAGVDKITGDAEANRLEGGGGADVLSGLGADDTLLGQGGADNLTGGPGTNDVCNGGAGTDTFAPSCEVKQGTP
ncbi:MAG: hypothetical protein WEB00_13970 [Dehalococcoidia bacterium]